MAKFTDEQFDAWIADYEADRARAQAKVDSIEKEGIRYEEGVGNEPMADVTDELLADWKKEVALYDRLIAHYKKWKAQP